MKSKELARRRRELQSIQGSGIQSRICVRGAGTPSSIISKISTEDPLSALRAEAAVARSILPPRKVKWTKVLLDHRQKRLEQIKE